MNSGIPKSREEPEDSTQASGKPAQRRCHESAECGECSGKKKQINGTEINESLKTAKKKKNKDFQKRKVES